jgi:serine phosphatase RsbU (regulator of sigma subunit)/tetratricopeptide (TPR) repeat protein
VRNQFLITLAFLALSLNSTANSDSLWSIWNNPDAHDTARLESMNKYIWAEYLFYDPDSAFILAQQHYDFADEKDLDKYRGQALGTQGVSYAIVGDYVNALDYYEQSLVYCEKANYKKGIASTANNIGVIYYDEGDLQKAIDNYIKSMNTMQELGEIKAVAKAQSNIGLVYMDKGDYTNAIDFFNKSLNNAKRIDDSNGRVIALSNIGILYSNINEYEKALNYFKMSLDLIDDETENNLVLKGSSLDNIASIYGYLGDRDMALGFYMKSLAIKVDLGNPYYIASTLNNIGTVYLDDEELELALDYFERSVRLFEENEGIGELATPLINLADIEFRKKKYYSSIKLAKKSLKLARESENLDDISRAAELLYESYKKVNEYQESLLMYELADQAKDSILSDQNQRELIRYSFKFEYEKKAEADSLLALQSKIKTDAQIATQKAQLEKEQLQRYTLYGGVLLLLFFGGFIFNRYKVTQKQKEIIESQKDEVESQRALLDVKNNEILDSIIYAKRIQSAILPPDRIVKKHLPNSFIIYKPKDVVAGDFYWMRDIDGTTLFAAADCTGHGVPGAMVSVVCNNALNRSVREYGLSKPNEILDKAREIVVKEFEKSDEDVNDGMDIALCSIKDNHLEYAGANIPLIIIRNGEILVTKPDKQPIGIYLDPKPYTSHSIELESGDNVYILSDGFVDQFGGPKGKKFKSRPLKELLLKMSDKEIAEQKSILEKTFKEWKGDLEQVDDICFIGLKLS